MDKKFKFANPTLNPAGGSGAQVFDNNYLDEIREELIGSILLEGKTLDWAHIIPNVKNRVSLNTIGNITEFGDAGCGWNPEGDMTLVQRDLTVYPKQIQNTICWRTLYQTYLGSYMKGREDIPFIGVIADEYRKTTKLAVENFIWKTALYPMIGQPQFLVDGGISASLAVDAETTMIGRVNAMVAAAPAEVLSRPDAVLIMSDTDFVAYQQELVAANLFHYDANMGSDMTLYVPGTNVKVRATTGMNGIAAPTEGWNLILTYEDNVAVGTDLATEDSEAIFDIFWSRDNNEARVNIQVVIGANVYFPQYVVRGYK